MTGVVETVKTVLTPILAERKFDLWDVIYEKQDSDMVLRILVDRQHDAITMDDLVMLTELIGEQLDQIAPDPFPAAYMMDVSSPGAQRALKRLADFNWALEKTIHLELNVPLDDLTEFDAELQAVTDSSLTLVKTTKGKRKTLELPMEQVKSAHLAISQVRILTSQEDFAWAINKMVHVSTYQKIAGVKDFTGELIKADETILELKMDDEQVVEIPRAAVAQARQANDF